MFISFVSRLQFPPFVDIEYHVSCIITIPLRFHTRTGGGDVAALKFNIIDEGSEGLRPFTIDGLSVEPFRVNHGVCSNGDPFWSLGFRFDRLVYISDCNLIPNESFEVMKGADTLILDALHGMILCWIVMYSPFGAFHHIFTYYDSDNM